MTALKSCLFIAELRDGTEKHRLGTRGTARSMVLRQRGTASAEYRRPERGLTNPDKGNPAGESLQENSTP